MSSTLVIHGTQFSGHTHRVESFVRILGLPYRKVDAPAAVRASPAFRALNPLGQIPVLEDGDLVLSDSNAILVYLARRYAAGSQWLPDEPIAAAQVQRWLAIAAAEMRFGPAAARMIILWNGAGRLEEFHALAERLLVFMDHHLANRQFLAAEHPTIADISGYPYIARAPEGKISLEPYPHVRAWLARVEALPGFIPMPVAPAPSPSPGR